MKEIGEATIYSSKKEKGGKKMIRTRVKEKISYSAEIVWEEKRLGALKNIWLKELQDGILEISNEAHKLEGIILWNCIRTGKRVRILNKEIQLYEDRNSFEKEPDFIILNNPELYSLLENLVQSSEKQKTIH